MLEYARTVGKFSHSEAEIKSHFDRYSCVIELHLLLSVCAGGGGA
jgi:hypothetical protein